MGVKMSAEKRVADVEYDVEFEDEGLDGQRWWQKSCRPLPVPFEQGVHVRGRGKVDGRGRGRGLKAHSRSLG